MFAINERDNWSGSHYLVMQNRYEGCEDDVTRYATFSDRGLHVIALPNCASFFITAPSRVSYQLTLELLSTNNG